MFIVQLPPVHPEMLLKLAGHPEDRLRERTSLPVEALRPVRAGARDAKLPPGSHHVRLPDGSYAVLKDISRPGGQPRHVVATVLSSEMSPPGYDVTGEIIDVDPDDVKVISFGEGDKQRAHGSYRAQERKGKNSYSFSEEKSLSSVKVAQVNLDDVRDRLRALRHDASTADKYRVIVERKNVYLKPEPGELPMREPPPNDSDVTMQEIEQILSTMRTEPLDEDFVQRASASVNRVFYTLCDDLNLPHRADLASDVSKDALRLSMVLKYHYLRPRPYQVAPYFDHDVQSTDMAAEETPSYPSGHSMMGFALARLYARLYPEHADQFTKMGDHVGLSRIQAGVHYPSDVAHAEELIDAMMGPAPTRAKEASLMGAAIGAATSGKGTKEKAVAATGGATGGFVGGIAGLGAGWVGAGLLGAGFAGKGTGALIGNTIGAGVGGYYGGKMAVNTYRRGLRKKTPNLDKRVKKS